MDKTNNEMVAVFNEKLYRLLRQYQDGKIEDTHVAAGKLTPQLTVVYDTVRELVKAVLTNGGQDADK